MVVVMTNPLRLVFPAVGEVAGGGPDEVLDEN